MTQSMVAGLPEVGATMSRRDPDHEPDFEAIQEARDEARAEGRTFRLDQQYGRIEDWRTPKQEER